MEIFAFKGEEGTTNIRCDGYLEVKYLGVTKATQTVSMKDEKYIGMK